MSTGQAIPVPPPAQQQSKTVEATARSFFKGGMALGLQNLAHALHVNRRNVDRFQNKLEGVPSAHGATGAEDMRIDSDDIHNHYHQQREGMSGLAKVAAIAMAATGVGIPASIAAMQLPEIVAQFLPADQAPATPTTDAPTLNIGGTEYQLSLEPEEATE